MPPVPVRALPAARYVQTGRRHHRPQSPADLARRLDPTFVVTPTIALLSDIGARAVTQPNRRDIITAPPRTGKSQSLAIWTPVWALMTNPDMQIVVVSNGDDLAQEHSRAVRGIVREHADFLGYRIAQDKTAVGRWRVEGRRGGMLAAGINSHIVGFGADLMIIDDVVGGAVEADSAAHRRRVLNEYQGSLSTRIHPGGSALLVMCMTGDTPVRMADGTERPLGDVRVGDEISTYEDGAVSTSTVRNWCSQGRDDVFIIRLESGRTVRANARHPFLVVDEEGRESWVRLSELQPGDRVVAISKVAADLTTLEDGVHRTGQLCGTPRVSRAPSPNVTSRCAVRGCACRTTTDEIVAIEPDGVAEVFDIQVERTENFIANGLVSHNTRWHEQDLAGELLQREPDEWQHTNVTAIGDPAVPDALDKPAGAAMVSALGFTPAEFARRRRAAGERMWYAQYMGVPSAPEGGLVKKAWLDDHRLLLPPRNPTLTVVGVDPAESGSGDEAGIVAASLTQDGSIVMIADKTAQMTSDEWVKASVALAVEVGASRIVVEAFSAGETYRRLLTEEVKQADRDIAVVAWPPRGSRRGGGDSHTRSAALLAQLENGLTRLAGHFPDWETRATGWQAGQHQPDGLSALVVAHDELIHAAGLEWDMAMPFESAAVVSLESWMSRPLS